MDESKRVRAMLDERGIEYTANDEEHVKETCWPYMGELMAAFAEYDNGTTRFACDTWCFTPEQAIAATVGTAMTLDEATEYAERFMGDYAKLLLASTLYVERDEPTDQHALNVAEQKEAQMARTLAEALATVRTEPDEATMLKLHSRMNAALLDMNEELLAYHSHDRENASSKELIDCVIRAHQIVEDASTVGVGTCRNAVMCNVTDCEYNHKCRCTCDDLEIQDQECMTYRCRDIDYDEEEE